MYFTKVRLNGLSAVDLPIVGALPSDLYVLKGIDGLGPPEIDVTIKASVNAGATYQGRRPQLREIVALVGLNPVYGSGMTASDLRTTLYGLLSPNLGNSILVQIMNGTTIIAQTTGYVKKMEISPFSKDPEVQVTISCIESWLQEPNSLFIAPPADKTYPVITYAGLSAGGLAAVGFHLEIVFTAAYTGFTMTNLDTSEYMTFFGTGLFAIGDTLVFDTRPGHRGIWLIRAGVTTSILYAFWPGSKWLTLIPGDNHFFMSTPNFNWGDIYYVPQYWGI